MQFSPLGHIPLAGTGMRRFDNLRDQEGFLPHIVQVLGGSKPDLSLYPWGERPVVIVMRKESVATEFCGAQVLPRCWEAEALDIDAMLAYTSKPQHRAKIIYAGELAIDESRPVLAVVSCAEEFLSQDARTQLAAAHTQEWVSAQNFAKSSFDDLEENREEGAWAAVLSAATALSNWHSRYGFDPATGAPTTVVHSGWARCTAEGKEIFPRTDPAVITAVTAEFGGEEKILLGHARAWPVNRFSTFAGFVEVGESLENTVERELFEEAGVQVQSMTYMGSQPWPFPRSLMLGYRAVAANPHRVRPDGDEIDEVRWFSRGELVAAEKTGEIILPGRSSISRKLIDGWLNEN